MPGVACAGNTRTKDRADVRTECRRTDRGVDAPAGNRAVDCAIHRHARAALARRLSQRGLDADPGCEHDEAPAREAVAGMAPMAIVCDPLFMAVIRNLRYEQLLSFREPHRPFVADLRRDGA